MTSASHFRGAQGGSGIGGEIGVARSCRENDDATLLEVSDGAAKDKRFSNLIHRDRTLHPRGDAHFFQTVHESERVDDGGEHAHVVAGGPVDPAFFARQATEDIPAPDDDPHLHAQGVASPSLGSRPVPTPPLSMGSTICPRGGPRRKA
jgi:hypothetical protein